MRGFALALLAAAVIVMAVRWGSFVAGGPDSYCYVNQAQRWAAVLTGQGDLQVPEPLALEAPWPNASLTFAPIGHTASPTVAGAAVPICPAGLSLAMAPFVAVAGPKAAFAVVPLFGVLLVLATFVVGSRYGARIGMASALLTASSPAFLYQVVQPMSDVPAAALWMLAIASATGTRPRSVVWSGLLTSAAILVRPNLVPLGFAIGVYLLLRPERPWPDRIRHGLTYAAASLPGCLGVAAVQSVFFGSPTTSGYGSFDALFGLEHVWPNVQRYSAWLWQTHTPALALALLAPLMVPGALATLFLGLFALNLALYLPYIEFEDWSFLRFLLPTLPLLLILMVAVIDGVIRRAFMEREAVRATPSTGRPALVRVAIALVAVGLAVLFVRQAIDRNAFRLQALESRFERSGVYVRSRLPANALVFTSWQSGSVRFYGERKTVVWSELEPSWFDRALQFARDRGYEPYLLLERWEEPGFRLRFAETSLGALDWPPAAEIGGQVRVYRPGDRARYLEGTAAPTEYAR
jgi:hypothetical protein